MKRKVIAVLILIILFIFGGCGVRDNTHTTEFYKIYVHKNTATILELTDKGKEQEVLIIPSEFKGNPVKKIGMVLYYGSSARFKSEKLKKIYIPETVNLINHGSFIFCNNLKELVVSSNNFENVLKNLYLDSLGIDDKMAIEGLKIYLPNNYYQNVQDIERSETFKELYKNTINPANISFNYNYQDSPNEGYYFIDNISDTGKITKPDNPKRQGYAFVSWYLEPEFKNEWNFETDEVIVEKDEEGNPIYSETILYARWAKID